MIKIEKRPLTEEERIMIWDTICLKMTSEDRDPNKVIEEDFDGDKNAYLTSMAEWHNITLGEN